MTRDDIAELERLLAAYHTALGGSPRTRATARRQLETALVRNADELIAAAKAHRPPFSPYAEVRAE